MGMRGILIGILCAAVLGLAGTAMGALVVNVPHPDDAEPSCGGLIANTVAEKPGVGSWKSGVGKDKTVDRGWGKIKTLNNNVKSASKVESILKEKEQELITYQGQLDSYVDISAGVLPEKNPALLVVTQLKKIALENNIFLEDLKISSQQVVKGEISDLKVNFKVQGIRFKV